MKVLVTIVTVHTSHAVSVGDQVLLRKDPTNESDPDAIQVYAEGEVMLGYVGNKDHTVKSGCYSATDVKGLFRENVTGVIESVGTYTMKKGQVRTSYICKVLVEENNEGENDMPQEYKFRLVGAKTLYPNKFKLTDELQKGIHPTIRLVNDGDKIVAYFADGLCGCIDNRKQDGVYSFDELKDLFTGEKVAKIVRQVSTSFIGVLTLSETEASRNKASRSLEGSIEHVVSEGLASKAEVDERVSYMKKFGVTDKQMATLFDSYKAYDSEIQKRIPHPSTLYQDSSGILRRSIAYVNTNRNLLFEGDRGVGKNVLTETLAWLYKRPLYEFSLNSQHDNNSLLGGKTIVSETTEDGKERTQVAYDPDVIVQSAEVGGILVFDEFNTSFGHVMSLFNSLLDDRRRLQVPGYKNVDADVNFVAIATQNKDYQGTFENNEATIDRFVPIEFPPLKSITDILMAKIPSITVKTVEKCQQLFAGIKKCVEDGNISDRAVTIRGFIDACKAIDQDIPLKESLIDNVANRAQDRDERKVIKDMIEDIVG